MQTCKCCSNKFDVESGSKEGEVEVVVKFKADAMLLAMVKRAFENGEWLERRITMDEKDFTEIVDCWVVKEKK